MKILYTLVVLALLSSQAICGSLQLASRKLHLRSGETREWRAFPATSMGRTATIEFKSQPNTTEYSLILRQRDVKNRTWMVSLNGQNLGVLKDDERSMLRMLRVPVNLLRTGSNTLQITGEAGGTSDDIELTDIRLESMPVTQLLTEATVDITVTGENGSMPVKVTVVDSAGSLVPFASLRSGAYEAVRTGVVYTADGKANIGLPAGEYRIYASRGFEYSAPVETVRLEKSSKHTTRLGIRREVQLPGYVSADTHVHTFELSRHGDATVEERVLTAAGEGLDVIIATEHNRVDDYTPALTRKNLDRWTVAVPGNEVTTPMGHFNIFPTRPGAAQPDPHEKDWVTLMRTLKETEGVQVVVQNHPRDLHSNYRPFDPSHHLSSAGVNLRNRPVLANAMEVVNSGAMSSDPLQLVRDWMGLLTRGLAIAAVGASDTHTVDFVPIGQARTYIDAKGLATNWHKENKPLFAALADGRNLVSYGLATELRIAGPMEKGKQVTVPVDITVRGPSWSSADHVAIYSNGRIIWEDSMSPSAGPDVKYGRRLSLTLPPHDTALVAVATGPGVLLPFWEVRKPYQPTSHEWNPRVVGVSAAVQVDGDGDGSRSAPRQYAERIVKESSSDLPRLVEVLSHYDSSVSLHALDLMRNQGVTLENPELRAAFDRATSTREAYKLYASELAQVRSEQ
jgi:hypothetical protein